MAFEPGGHDVKFITTGSTVLTLPTSGTLAVQGGDPVFDDVTIDALTVTTVNGLILNNTGVGVASLGTDGTVAFSGAFETTIRATNDTDVTLPLTGVLLGQNLQELTGNGALAAVSLATTTTDFQTAGGAATSTLAAATVQGQIKIITMSVDGGDAVVTVATGLYGGGTTITLDAVGDAIVLMFIQDTWMVISNNNCTIA